MPRAIETIDINTTVLHYEETIGGVTETVAYLPLRKDSDGVVVVRDVCLAGRRINPTNVSNYIDSEMDSWLIDDQAGYLSYFDVKMRACIIPTTIKVKPYDSDDITEIARQAFLLSTSEVGFTGVADEGESILPVLKSHRDTTNDNTARIAYNSAGTAAGWWLRSANSAEQMRRVHTGGSLGSHGAATAWVCPRPAVKVRNGTMVSDETEDTIYILPDPAHLYRELEFVAYLGEAENRPKKAKVQVEITNATESSIKISNNAKDANPVWVECANGGAAELANTVKETANWELGVKIYAKSGGRATVGEAALIVEVEQ